VNNNLKIALGLGLGYAGYKLYKLYKLGEEIQFTPVGFEYVDSTIKIKMRLDNPIDTTLKMRGVDGTIALENGTLLGVFSSDPFLINEGVSYFTLNISVNTLNLSLQVVQMLVSFNTPKLILTMYKRIPFVSIKEVMVIEPAKFK